VLGALPSAFLNTAGDLALLPKVLDAAERFERPPPDEVMSAMLKASDDLAVRASDVMGRLDGRVALVTAAAAASAARSLWRSARGRDVVVNYNAGASEAAEVVTTLEKAAAARSP